MEGFELLDLQEIRFDKKYLKNIEDIQNYFKIRDEMKQFIFKCNFTAFKRMFDKDAERLWKHFFQDCGANLEKFETYLTKDQLNVFIVNGLLNKKLLI